MNQPTPDPICRACGETTDSTAPRIGSFHRACIERLLQQRPAAPKPALEGVPQ